jgi:hypothetical protein
VYAVYARFRHCHRLGARPVIKALLAAGADKSLKDSRGRTALEYLQGKGPVPANPLLKGTDLAEAIRLLSN